MQRGFWLADKKIADATYLPNTDAEAYMKNSLIHRTNVGFVVLEGEYASSIWHIAINIDLVKRTVEENLT